MELKLELPKWNVEEFCGYKPMTTFWQDFSIAEKFGLTAVIDTYINAEYWHTNYKYWTELVMVLNHKSHYWYHRNSKMFELYEKLYIDAESYVDEWNEDEQYYYFQITD